MLYTIIRKGGEYMAVSYSNRIRSLRKKLKMTQKQMALVRTQTKELIDSLSATQVFEVKGYIRRMIESKSEDE